jgi:hypothetical protein
LPVFDRYERGTAPTIEIEAFDWLAPQAPAKRLITSIHTIAPREGVWLLDDHEPFVTLQQAETAVRAKHGEPRRASKRTDGGINLYYRKTEDDPFEI